MLIGPNNDGGVGNICLLFAYSYFDGLSMSWCVVCGVWCVVGGGWWVVDTSTRTRCSCLRFPYGSCCSAISLLRVAGDGVLSTSPSLPLSGLNSDE